MAHGHAAYLNHYRGEAREGRFLYTNIIEWAISVNAVQGMDITKLKIYMFDDLELWVQVYEEGAESKAVDQAVLSAEIDLS